MASHLWPHDAFAILTGLKTFFGLPTCEHNTAGISKRGGPNNTVSILLLPWSPRVLPRCKNGLPEYENGVLGNNRSGQQGASLKGRSPSDSSHPQKGSKARLDLGTILRNLRSWTGLPHATGSCGLEPGVHCFSNLNFSTFFFKQA